MRKNKMMRAASALLVAVLLTTSTISGTFAKYVTEASGSDTARVAKWGVEVGLTGYLFDDSYDEEPKEWTANEDIAAINVQASTEHDYVVAPGTENKTGLTFKLTGQPEVDTEVKFEIKANSEIRLLTGTYTDYTQAEWVTDPADKNNNIADYTKTFDVTSVYYPVVFTLKDGNDNKLAEGTLADIQKYFDDNLNKIYHTNTLLDEIVAGNDGTYTLTWVWAFESGNDAADTFLGNVMAGVATSANAVTNMDVEIVISATQVD